MLADSACPAVGRHQQDNLLGSVLWKHESPGLKGFIKDYRLVTHTDKTTEC